MRTTFEAFVICFSSMTIYFVSVVEDNLEPNGPQPLVSGEVQFNSNPVFAMGPGLSPSAIGFS